MLFERRDVFRTALVVGATTSAASFVRMNNRPWATLDPGVAAPLRPRVPTLVDEVIEAVQTALPEYEALDPAVARGGEVGPDGIPHLLGGGGGAGLPGPAGFGGFRREA